MGKSWINLINLGQLSKCSHPLLLTLHLFKSILLHVHINVWQTVYSHQTPHSAASDLGLHCLLRTIFPNI